MTSTAPPSGPCLEKKTPCSKYVSYTFPNLKVDTGFVTFPLHLIYIFADGQSSLHFLWWPIKSTIVMNKNCYDQFDQFSSWSTQNWATFSLFLTWSSVWNIQTVSFPANWHNLLHISLCLNNKYLNNYNQSEPSDQHKIELHLSLNLVLHFPNRCLYLKYSNYLIPMNCP
jgi:hypothetical protein